MLQTQNEMKPKIAKQRASWLIGGIALLVMSVGLLFACGYQQISPSRGDGTAPISLLPYLLLIAILLGLIRLLPAGQTGALAEEMRPQMKKGTYLLIGYTLVLPWLLLLAQILWGQDGYFFAKVLLILVYSCILFLSSRHKPLENEKSTRSLRRWLIPCIVILAYCLLTSGGFFAISATRIPGLSKETWLDYLVLSLVTNILTAGIAEELLYRKLLQTRLELLFGHGNGIALAAFLFAWMHFPTRFQSAWLGQTGQPLLDALLALAAVVSFQGAMGVLFGYFWFRYRNFWLSALFHTLANVLPFLLSLKEVML